MLKLVIILALTACLSVTSSYANFQSECSCGERQLSDFGRGNLAAKGEFPWRVSIFAGDFKTRVGRFCDGSIISPSWILVSAYCIQDLRYNDKVSVYFNATHPFSKSWINADDTITHPGYNAVTGANNLALVHLNYRLHFGKNVAPICLPWGYTDEFLNQKNLVETQWSPTALIKHETGILTNSECKKEFGSQIKDEIICSPNVDCSSCSRDATSSVEYHSPDTGRSFLVGMYTKCGAGNIQYTEIGDYLDWILKATRIIYCEKKITEPSAGKCSQLNMVGTDAKVQSIIRRILDRTPNDLASLIPGLQAEIESDVKLQNTWNQATANYNQLVAEGKFKDEADLRVYHIALLTYTLDGFFGEFNWATYSIADLSGADTYPYPYYMKIIDQAIQKVKGAPAKSAFDANTVLYRGMGGRVVAKIGDRFSLQQIVSTSRSKEVADKYASQNPNCQTLFVITGPIKNRIGLDDHSVGTAKGNLEVLLPPEQSYVVTNIEENGLQRIISLYAV